MVDDDKPEFVRVLNGIADLKRVELTKAAYEMWWNAMRSWSIDDFRDASGYLLTQCRFMPEPYDFEQLRAKQRPSAHEAWADALAYAHGGWRHGPHDDPTIDRVVRSIGGWSTLALCDLDKLGFIERRFLDTYRDFGDGDQAREALPQIARQGQPLQVGNLAKRLQHGG